MSGTNLTSYIIYPAGEIWIGVDQSPCEIDKETYNIFLDFLKDYFYQPSDIGIIKERSESASKQRVDSNFDNDIGVHTENFNQKHRNSQEVNTTKSSNLTDATNNEALRAIPGGRYG